jgi:hypothetical protein
VGVIRFVADILRVVHFVVEILEMAEVLIKHEVAECPSGYY